jgi:hypothetical protein
VCVLQGAGKKYADFAVTDCQQFETKIITNSINNTSTDFN